MMQEMHEKMDEEEPEYDARKEALKGLGQRLVMIVIGAGNGRMGEPLAMPMKAMVKTPGPKGAEAPSVSIPCDCPCARKETSED